MVATSLSVIVLAGMASAIYSMTKTAKTSISESDATLDNMDIRRQFEQDLRGISTVIKKSDNEFRFYTSDMFSAKREIDYKVDRDRGNLRLLRTDITEDNVEKELLTQEDDGLTDVTFTYYNQMGILANTAADTNAIKIKVERHVEGSETTIQRDIEITMMMFRNKVYDVNGE